MKTLIIYDSYFGNTEKIAKTISEELKENTVLKKVKDFKNEDLISMDLLIVGSPTRAFTFSDNILTFLTALPVKGLYGIKVTSFDTRIDIDTVKSKLLSFAVNKFGYADKKILKRLIMKGGEKVLEPEGFIVTDKEGPLKDGETERAKEWIRGISLNK